MRGKTKWNADEQTTWKSVSAELKNVHIIKVGTYANHAQYHPSLFVEQI